MNFQVGQVVRGAVAGVFVILKLTTEDGQPAARVQAVNPNDHTQRARGSLVLPFSALREL
jgi:predicted RecA/RadA family phage recombinase